MNFPEQHHHPARFACAGPQELRDKLDAIVAEEKTSFSAVMRELLKAGLKVYEGEKGAQAP